MKPIKKIVREPLPIRDMEESIIEGDEIIEDEKEFEPIKGVVFNCTSLYVRMAPHSNATPVDTIDEGTIVNVIGEDEDFWKLESPEGYSMKKFIKVV